MYKKRSDLSYTIKYLNQNSGEPIQEPTIIGNQIFLNELTENAIDIEGYKTVGETSKTITINTEGNEIVFYYEIDENQTKELSYIVEYYYENEIDAIQTETINDIIGDTYNTKYALINGYGLIREDNPSNSKGKMTGLKTIVKYYYTPVSGTPLTNNEVANGNTENSVVKKATNANKSNKKDAGNEADYPSTGDNLPVITISVMLIVVMANILQIRLELLNSNVKIRRNKQTMELRKTRHSNISRIERNCSKHAKIKLKNKGKGRRAK